MSCLGKEHPMDKILLNQLQFYGYHGVYPEETKLGQRYIVDLILYVDLRTAGQTDNLEKTVNYADIFSLVKDIVEGEPYKLIEAVAEKISVEIFSNFTTINKCMVKITKPNPPINGQYESVAVEILRERT